MNQTDWIDMLNDAELEHMRAAAVRIIGNPMDADDVVQQSLIQAWRSPTEFRGEAARSSWLVRIAINASYDFIRARKRDDTKNKQFMMQSEEIDPRGFTSDMTVMLEQAVASLPPDQREALHLTALNGVDPAAAAKMMGKSLYEVNKLVSKAKETLKNNLLRGEA